FDEQDFISALNLSPLERDAVTATLRDFPASCQSRGMFFLGVLDRLKSARGADEATRALERVGITYRITAFGLHPHRDFYKLFFYVARAVYPAHTLASGVERLAESFFPIFATSLAGRTLIALLDKDPVSVLGRFVDAYRIACPSNQHRLTPGEAGVHRWSCEVEPCDFYPSIFQGICRGMVRGVTGIEPVVTVVDKQGLRSGYRYELSISMA